jgi:4-hydroxy-tetrahydrodipicolinate reductase
MADGTPIRVGVLGAAGRMGTEVCRAVHEAADLELVAAFDPGAKVDRLADLVSIETDLALSSDLTDIAPVRMQVAVDFTHLDAARRNLAWLADHGVHAVVGTTGFTDGDVATLEERFTRSNCVIAPNFAISAVLMMRFAELAAPLFDTAEIIELHHDQKIDAPSGTAMMTAERMAAASSDWGDDPTENELVVGARGGRGPGGIPMHSVRMRGMVAHQEVILGAMGQTLTLRQDSYDRSSFMPGVLLAVRHVAARSGVTVGLDALLDI